MTFIEYVICTGVYPEIEVIGLMQVKSARTGSYHVSIPQIRQPMDNIGLTTAGTGFVPQKNTLCYCLLQL
jgi:hypothetical protein